MALAFNEIVGSPVFSFLVGKDQKPMTIHTSLVAKQSSMLEKLVSGPMKESQTRTTVWEDVDEDTFGLFAQFVYTGNYTPPAFVTQNSKESSIPDLADSRGSGTKPLMPAKFDNSESDLDSLGPRRIAKYGIQKKAKLPSWRHEDGAVLEVTVGPNFHKLGYHLPAAITDYADKCRPQGNTSYEQDFTPVFLGHARLYVLADKYDIELLKALALNKLHETLCKFYLSKARYGDVVELVRYAYESTPSRMPRDALRELAIQYVGEAREVAKSEQGLNLIEQNGQFARDLFSVVFEEETVLSGIIKKKHIC